jgi:hypothetical protein
MGHELELPTLSLPEPHLSADQLLQSGIWIV